MAIARDDAFAALHDTARALEGTPVQNTQKHKGTKAQKGQIRRVAMDLNAETRHLIWQEVTRRKASNHDKWRVSDIVTEALEAYLRRPK